MKARLLLSMFLLFVAVFLMFVALRYFFLYLETGDCAGSVFFFTWAGIGVFAIALRTKPGFGRRTNYELR